MSDATYPAPSNERPTAAYAPVTPWRPLEAALAVIVAFVVSLACGFAAVASVGFDGPRMMIAGTLVQQATMVALVWWLAGLRGGRRSEVLALGPPRHGWWSYVEAFAIVIVSVAAMSSLIQMFDPEIIRSDLKQFAAIIDSPLWWAMFPMVGIGAPLWEELTFRGFLLSSLAKSRLGVAGGALLLSAAWAAVHSYSITGMMQVFVIGLVFCAILVRSGSLRVPIVVHALYNVLVTSFLVSDAGREFLTR